MNTLLHELKDKKVLILGLGLQGGGLGDALYLHKHGVDIRVTDKKSESDLASSIAQLPSDIPRTLGGHSQDDLDWADIIIKNPAVPDDSDMINLAREKNIPIHTSAALFVKHTASKVIGITGTRGKTTTVHLTYDLLTRANLGKIALGGNIPGTSLLSLHDEDGEVKYTVLELSSFQLSGFHTLRVSPHIAVMTNIYEDHLNRYSSMEEYVADKSAIMRYQSANDYLIVNKSDSVLTELAMSSPANVLYFDHTKLPASINPIIPGAHNLENFSSIYEISKILEIDESIFVDSVNSFPGIPYRQQTIRTVNGITYVNDTTSTTPVATIKAIDASTSPIHLILGGESKNLTLTDLFAKLHDPKIKSITVLGSANNHDLLNGLKSITNIPISYTQSMKEAVDASSSTAREGDAVILSPGFASFDLFKNEFDRGDQFNQIVREL